MTENSTHEADVTSKPTTPSHRSRIFQLAWLAFTAWTAYDLIDNANELSGDATTKTYAWIAIVIIGVACVVNGARAIVKLLPVKAATVVEPRLLLAELPNGEKFIPLDAVSPERSAEILRQVAEFYDKPTHSVIIETDFSSLDPIKARSICTGFGAGVVDGHIHRAELQYDGPFTGHAGVVEFAAMVHRASPFPDSCPVRIGVIDGDRVLYGEWATVVGRDQFIRAFDEVKIPMIAPNWWRGQQDKVTS